MKFIVDAQLPKSLSEFLKETGQDSIHTLELPLKNATSDSVIRTISSNEQRIVISKDSDFLQSHLVQNVPEKLILVRTGNIHNKILLNIFRSNFNQIMELLNESSLIEVTETEIISHK